MAKTYFTAGVRFIEARVATYVHCEACGAEPGEGCITPGGRRLAAHTIRREAARRRSTVVAAFTAGAVAPLRLCACGCGQQAPEGRRFIRGHNKTEWWAARRAVASQPVTMGGAA
jgi:hypothetical protein